MSHDAGHVHGPTCGGTTEGGWLDRIRWDEDGLVPAIAQDAASHRVLMMAWMNREALAETLRTGHAVYWSRSRQRLWRKGEESGNQQRVHEIRTDCDADVILLFIDQVGGVACHTGRESCFFRRLEGGRLGQGAAAAEAGALSSPAGGPVAGAAGVRAGLARRGSGEGRSRKAVWCVCGGAFAFLMRVVPTR